MPIPKRKTGERRTDYLQRCMGDKTMTTEYPDAKQRYAVCISKSKE